nr:hypothetical protein [Thermosynechococcus vestitus]
MIFAGTPAATTAGGISETTTEELPMTAPAPIRTPLRIRTFAPMKTLSPTTTGAAHSGLDIERSAIARPWKSLSKYFDIRAYQTIPANTDRRVLRNAAEIIIDPGSRPKSDPSTGITRFDIRIAIQEPRRRKKANPNIRLKADDARTSHLQRLIQNRTTQKSICR